MYKSKLIELYKTLDTNHIETARKWVNSPVHNRHKDVVKLFDFLFSRQNLTELSLIKKRAFKYIYPDRKFDDLRLRHLMTLSLNTLEDFVSFSMQSGDRFEQKISLVRYCAAQNTDNLSNKYLRKIIREQEKVNPNSKITHYQSYKLNKELISSSENENPSENLKHLFFHHSHCFVLETLQLAVNNYRLIKKNNEIIPFFESILNKIKAGEHKESPLIQLYYSCYNFLDKPLSFKLFTELKTDLLRHKNVLELSDYKELFTIIIGFCIDLLFTKKHDYLVELIDLYKFGIESEIFMNSSGLNSEIYQDILSTALAMKNHIWAANFVTRNTSMLEKKLQAPFNRYARAMLLYSKGAHKSAAMILTADFSDIKLNFAAKSLLLKIHFANNASEAFEKEYASFRTLIKTKSTPSKLRNNYYEFTETIRILFSENSKKSQQNIIKEFAMDKNIFLSERLWLLKQFETL